ncbi:ABC-2 transporter permease [Paenibacillus phocaensis]|uniref:ABC-2 transporter permease n=1 Tax=Paenibacillus phocaensis TaxID=1776378 RepID=UPI0003A4DF85|nr:ABC-2 transporter permease [Paenibacillus phocaensis]
MEPSIDKELEHLERELREPLRQALQPGPTPSDTAALIAALQPEFDALRAQSEAKTLDFNPYVEAPSLRRLLWSQFRLNRRSLVLTGAAVFLMLIFLVDPARPFSNFLFGNDLPGVFPLVTPLMLMASMLYSYRSWDRGMRAVESITPYPPSLVVYSRMLMVIALVVGWALISTVIVGIRVTAAGEATMPFIPFLLQWLGISLMTGGAAMYALFRYGVKTALFAAAGIYLFWLFAESGSLALHGIAGRETALNAALLLGGIVLLHRSYRRSRILQVAGADAEERQL